MSKFKYYSVIEKSTGEEVRKLWDKDELESAFASGLWEFPKEEKGNAPGIISGYGLKPDDGFRSLLTRMKKNNPGSTINNW